MLKIIDTANQHIIFEFKNGYKVAAFPNFGSIYIYAFKNIYISNVLMGHFYVTFWNRRTGITVSPESFINVLNKIKSLPNRSKRVFFKHENVYYLK